MRVGADIGFPMRRISIDQAVSRRGTKRDNIIVIDSPGKYVYGGAASDGVPCLMSRA